MVSGVRLGLIHLIPILVHQLQIFSRGELLVNRTSAFGLD